MADDFSVVAIIAAYNEADIIGTVVRSLIDQQIAVYLIDDGSSDGTAEAVERYASRGVIGVERRGPTAARPGAFQWSELLRRKEQLASELRADWFIHHDADEFRESPWGDLPLKDAIRRVDALGYNAIDFASLDFRPTGEDVEAAGDVRTAMRFYSESAPYDRVQIRCWKKTNGVDLTSSGGHEARFENRRVFPIRFISRHYPIRGQVHGRRKVFVERQPRFGESERAQGWHVQYDDFAEGTSFLRDPDTLTQYDPVDVRIGLALRHRGVEALEAAEAALQQALADAEAALQGMRSDLERKDEDILRKDEDLLRKAGELDELSSALAGRERELHAYRDEVARLTKAVEDRTTQILNLQSVLADYKGRLDAFQRSLSWRWTAPARAVYRLLGGA